MKTNHTTPGSRRLSVRDKVLIVWAASPLWLTALCVFISAAKRIGWL